MLQALNHFMIAAAAMKLKVVVAVRHDGAPFAFMVRSCESEKRARMRAGREWPPVFLHS